MRISRDSLVSLAGKGRVYDTALRELAYALEACAPPESLAVRSAQEDRICPETVFLAVLKDSHALRGLIRDGLLNLHNIPPELDAYELLIWNGALVLAGSTPRGMLHAVYRLQELVRELPRTAGGAADIPDELHIRETFQPRLRIFHQRFSGWPGERADIRYISHAGATHCLFDHDWHAQKQFQKFVTSPIFPNAENNEEVSRNHAGLRRIVEDCLDYALEPCMWQVEFPCQGGPWLPDSVREGFFERYPNPDAISDSATFQGKVLCFGHPLVQEYYRDLTRRFFSDFPEISLIFFFFEDSGGEFCDPDSCPRCKGMSKLAQRDRFVNFLIGEGRKYNPLLRVITLPWIWERFKREILDRQRALPSASGMFFPAQSDGWQLERQLHDYLREARDICRRTGQIFVGYDDFHWGDDSVHGLRDIQDYPLGIGAKMLRWHNLGADGVFDHWGGYNRDISSNSIACREFFQNPLADPEAVCRNIALRQFGSAAGPLVLESWRSLERAHTILSNDCNFPGDQWPNWYSGRTYLPTPDGFSKYLRYYYDEANGQDILIPVPIRDFYIPKKAVCFTYNEGSFAERLWGVYASWKRAYPHYMAAAALMERAIGAADDEPLFYAFWWSGEGTPPTRREHLVRQKIYIESIAYTGMETGIHFGLFSVYQSAGEDERAYAAAARELLREDIRACRAAAGYFERLAHSGYDQRPVRDWHGKYLSKADILEEYLTGIERRE